MSVITIGPLSAISREYWAYIETVSWRLIRELEIPYDQEIDDISDMIADEFLKTSRQSPILEDINRMALVPNITEADVDEGMGEVFFPPMPETWAEAIFKLAAWCMLSDVQEQIESIVNHKE